MLVLPAEVTMGTARQVQQDLLAQCRQLSGSEVVRVHAGGLQRFDSSVLAVLLELERTTGRLQLEQVPQRLESLAQLYGVDALLWPDSAVAAA
ncbi:STAS domain-containing protein [Brachymonas chironomi]|uniref:STAS domain-containing protein n=1 Tax=Brachymonas chironomi TaxID=491919 RepID=UPI0004768BFD|nr:STAS domain-containing protein [Brachymonas chironomi]